MSSETETPEAADRRPGAAAAEDPDPANRECPERPRSEDVGDLGFVRRPMVRWLDPRQLLDTAARVVLAGIFGTYSDKRELQAFTPSQVYDWSEGDELWLDYVADLGDGWNSTYTIASLLASEKLELGEQGQAHVTERGRVLVMGGDQVYPVPKRAEYEDRMLGPYRAALPCVIDEHPDLFAIPGSHDWFDGLVNFTSVFCRGYWIGGWKTRQSRSYFALKLPHGWWLWGVDIQFGDYLDDAQLRYFSEEVAPGVQPEERIILCTAKALGTSMRHRHLYAERNLAYFEREVIRPTGAEVVLQVASGRHHYTHYREAGGSRRHIGAGGGGAFLHPTHHLPEQIELGGDGAASTYELQTTYPSKLDSRRLRKRLWLLPLRNLSFVGFLAAIHVLIALMLGLHQNRVYDGLGVGDLWRTLWTSPTAVLLVLLVLAVMGGMVRFAHDAPVRSTRVLLGLVHSGLQLASLTGVMVSSSRLSSALGLSGAGQLLGFFALVGLLGGAAGAFGMAGYLWATNWLGFHANEAYAPLRIIDFKHFLRLHVGSDGALTVYPVGVERVCRGWRLCPEGPRQASWFVPDEGDIEARLIEDPIRLDSVS